MGANKDVTKDAKNGAIHYAKLGANKGVRKYTKNWAEKWMQKWMLKRTKISYNRWHFTKLYNSTRFSAILFTTTDKKIH